MYTANYYFGSFDDVLKKLNSSSERRLSAEKLVPTFADRGSHEVSVTDPHGRYFFFRVTP
jgi:hypothetical protein